MQKRKANRKFVGKETIIDEHGVLLSEKNKYVEFASKPIYVSMYLDDDNVFDALKGLGNFGSAWGYVLQHYNHESCIFYFSSSVKEDMCQKLNLSIGTVRSAIRSFCDSGLLYRYRGAEYLVNPSFYYRGRWEDRQRVIQQYQDRVDEKEVKERDRRIDQKTVNV